MFRSPFGARAACLVLFVTGWVLAGWTLDSSAQPGLNAGPMVRLSEREWNLGELPQSDRRSHDFLLTNQGTAPLRIERLESSCGCTAALASDSVLAPGEKTAISVTFNSKDFEGEQMKVVVLHTNDPAEPRIDLVIRATVIPFVRVNERTLDFGKVRLGERPIAAAILEADPGTGFAVERAEGCEDYVEWKLTPISGAEGITWRVEARLRADAPLGRFLKRADLHLVHPRRGRESLTLKGLVYSYFELEKQKMDFLTVEHGKHVTRAIAIACDGSQPFRITNAVPSSPLFTPKLEALGNGYKLSVDLEPPTEPGVLHETVTLLTTDPRQPEIEIPVNAKVRPKQ